MSDIVTYRNAEGMKPNGRVWHGIDVVLGEERLDRSFLTDRELRHIKADPASLRVGFIQRVGRDGSSYEIVQLMLGNLAVGTRLKLNDVEKADVKAALAEQSASPADEDKKNR